MSEDARLKIELDYAWGWFQHSASQRLTTFNFFLVIVGLLLVAYAQAVQHEWKLFGIALGIVGAIVSVGFLAIDVRNEVFVNKGIEALKTLEANLTIKPADREEPSDGLNDALGKGRVGAWAVGWVDGGKDKDRKEKRANVFRYRFWFRRIISVIGIAFLAGLGWAAKGFPTAGGDETETCRSSTVLVLHRPGSNLSLVQRSEREGEQRSADDDRGRPDHGLGGDLHVQSVGMGDDKRVQTGRHCGKEPVGSG